MESGGDEEERGGVDDTYRSIISARGAPADNEDDEDFALPDVGDREIAVSFVTRGSMRGLAAAVVAAAVLCAKADGVLHDEEGDVLIPAQDALADARELLASIAAELE